MTHIRQMFCCASVFVAEVAEQNPFLSDITSLGQKLGVLKTT